LVALTLSLHGPAFAGGASVEGPPDKWWKEGPARYLLSEEESRRYGKLESPGAREAFVERFWKRRDPDRSTPENEARTRFEALCRRANHAFPESSHPGWSTDRGRVLILLGEPDAIRRDAGEARGRDREIWTYPRPPGGSGSPLEVHFYRTRSGQFTLFPGRETEGAAREDPVERERTRQRLRSRLRAENLGMSQVAIEQLTDLLLAPRAGAQFSRNPGTEVPLLRARPRIEPQPDDVHGLTSESAMSEGAFFFEAADGSVLVLLALEFRSLSEDGSADPSPAPAGSFDARAWIVDESGGIGALETPDPLDEIRMEAHVGPSGQGSVLFVGRAHLEAGSYGLRFAVLDSRHATLAVRSLDLEVPDLGSGRFTASSLVPAERFGPTTDGEASVFAVGSEEVVPRPGGHFRRGEPLRLYLQVYAAAPDPRSRKPRVDVKFRFFRKIRGAFRPHRKPLVIAGAEGASMGLALPVGDWPGGEYRVAVELHDRVSGARAETSGSFSLAD